MGMYTEIFFRAEVDDEAYSVIQGIHNQEVRAWPDHPFFKCPRFDLVTSCSSHYFLGANHYAAEAAPSYTSTGPILSISFRANLKNYDDEIEQFFDWVTPHCREYGGDRTFLGYSLYEEADAPTLYYKERS